MLNWKVTLPIGAGANADEVLPPAIYTYSDASFHLNAAGDAVVFDAPVDGKTTAGSTHARCELRELNHDGSGAAWATNVGVHTFVGRTAVTKLPPNRPHVIVAQLFNSPTPLTLRLEGSLLKIMDTDTQIGTMDAAYVLGTAFDWRIVASGGHVLFYYNNVLKLDYASVLAGCFFKAGSYPQSNLTNDAAGASATVEIRNLEAYHAA